MREAEYQESVRSCAGVLCGIVLGLVLYVVALVTIIGAVAGWWD